MVLAHKPQIGIWHLIVVLFTDYFFVSIHIYIYITVAYKVYMYVYIYISIALKIFSFSEIYIYIKKGLVIKSILGQCPLFQHFM